jgi:tripartite-type tricarboxylate transporter receptor subunit TctC
VAQRQDPEIQKLVASRAAAVGGDTPEELGKRIVSDLKLMGEIVREAKIAIEKK